MCSEPDGYGSCSSTYALRLGPAGVGFETSKARSSSQTRCHFGSIACGSYCSSCRLREQKSLSSRGRGELARRRRVGSLRYEKQLPFTVARPSSGPRPRDARLGCVASCACSSCSRASASATASSARRRRGAAAAEHGTPLLVFCEGTLREQARAYRAAAPDALVCLRDEGVPERRGACGCSPRKGSARTSRRSASSASRCEAGIAGRAARRAREQQVRRGAAGGRDGRRGLVVLDALDEVDARGGGGRSARARARHVRGRGRHARGDPHRPARLEVRAARRRTRSRRCAARSPPGSTSPACTSTSARSSSTLRPRARRSTGSRRSRRVPRASSGWTPAVVDLGGGLGVRTSRTRTPPSGRGVRRDARRRGSSAGWRLHGLPRAAARPRAGPLARRAARASRSTASASSSARARRSRYVAVDGGMSDNPRPQLYGARYTALLANRADEPGRRPYRGRRQALRVGRRADRARASCPSPRRGDLLAVPATGAYTLGDGLELQRRAAAGGRARRGRRGAPHPPPRDRRRPARARGQSSGLRRASIELLTRSARRRPGRPSARSARARRRQSTGATRRFAQLLAPAARARRHRSRADDDLTGFVDGGLGERCERVLGAEARAPATSRAAKRETDTRSSDVARTRRARTASSARDRPPSLTAHERAQLAAEDVRREGSLRDRRRRRATQRTRRSRRSRGRHRRRRSRR